ncbi:MAG: PAS domain S-box protein, partial [Deltaproteobacteria bacterium]|nr:PAS domain S-box protein [Deltaproteobacteria bacterium]
MSKILIVEDNAESRYLLERLLASKGHHIIAAENGEEALRFAHEDRPEVIISDIMMPVMNGFRLCREVKKDPGLRQIPFIFYTATFVQETDEKLAMSLGASRFVIKPTEGEAFLKILQEVLDEYQQGMLQVPEGTLNGEDVILEMYENSITRKLAETVERLQDEQKALIRSERRLKEAQELAHIGHWELDLKTDSLEWSDEIYRILGFKPQEFDPSYKALMSMEVIHPDDRADVASAHKESLSKRTPSDIEYRLLLKDGTVKYVNEKFQTLYDDHGVPTCSMGTVQDITERKQTEERLRFLSSAVEQSSEGMALADMEGNLIYVNQAWAEMHGYESSKALAGRQLSIFHNPEQLKNQVEPFNEMVLENGFHKGEVGHIRKDGKPFPTLMTTTLIKDEKGKPIALSGIAKDIADIKRAEAELKTERDTLQGLMDGLATTRIGVDIVGLNYRILHQNKVLVEAFGDITGKLCYENYMGLEIPCDSCPMTVAVKSGEVERAEMTGSDGRHYEILSAPLPSHDGAVDKAIEVVLDITDRKEAEKA